MYSDYQNVHVVFNRLIRMKPLLAIFRCNYLSLLPHHTQSLCASTALPQLGPNPMVARPSSN